MAKEDTDDKLKQGEIPGEGNERQEQEQEVPKDVRGALRAAIKEQAEKEAEDKSDVSVDTDATEKREHLHKRTTKQKDSEPNNKEVKSSRKAVSSDGEEGTDKEDIQSGDEQDKEPITDVSEQKLEPVGHWKAKAKNVWDKLDKEAQQEILNREKEVSQGFAQVSQRLKSLEEVEKVLAPRAQTIQQFGVSQAQIVDRLFQWMEALGHPNPAIKANAFKGLAQNFGLDINQLSPKQSEDTQNEDNSSSIDPNNPPPWFEQYTQTVQSEIGTLKQTLDSQKQAAADAFVNNWAKDKKYYGQVRQLMGQLLSSGAIPMKDNQLDLDGAYDAAIKLHPEVSAQMQQEASEKAKADAKAKAAQEARAKAEKLASAKRAGSGIKPGAPFNPVTNPSKLNGKKPIASVRDSIKAALEEARE